MNEPLASVLVMAYNVKPYIEKCISAILEQQCRYPFDVWVGEDCSSDGTRDWLNSSFFPSNVHILYNQQNKGLNANFNNLLMHAKGKYIAVCDGDDVWIDLKKLEKQIDFMEDNPTFHACFTEAEYYYVQENCKRINPNTVFFNTKKIFQFDDICRHNFITNSSVLYKHIYTIGLPSFILTSPAHDWSVHLHNSLQGPIAYLDFIGVQYTVHSLGDYNSTNSTERFVRRAESLILMKQYKYLSKSQLSILNFSINRNLYSAAIFAYNNRQWHIFIKKINLYFKTLSVHRFLHKYTLRLAFLYMKYTLNRN